MWRVLSAWLALAVTGGAAQTADRSGLRVEHRARALQPGEVVRLTVRTTEPLTTLQGQFGGRRITFWQGSAADEWTGLMGVDVETTPGEHAVTLDGLTQRGTRVDASHVLAILPKTFRERQLKVDPRFSDPPPSALPRIREESQRLEAVFANAGCPDAPAVAFALPSADPPSSPFGSRSFFNGKPRSRHNGVDFASQRGAPVVAPANGQIALVADLYFTGQTIVIAHGCGIYSLFAHFDRVAVEEGVRVSQGTRLGDVGSTGRSTGPHLHWSVRLHGARVDPLSLVSLAQADH